VVQDEGVVREVLPAPPGQAHDHVEMVRRHAHFRIARRDVVEGQEGVRPGIVGGVADPLGQGRRQGLRLRLVLDHGEQAAKVGIGQAAGHAPDPRRRDERDREPEPREIIGDGVEEVRRIGEIQGRAPRVVPVDESALHPGLAAEELGIEPEVLDVEGDLPGLVDLPEVHEERPFPPRKIAVRKHRQQALDVVLRSERDDGFGPGMIRARIEEGLGDVGRAHRLAAPVRAPGQLVGPAAADRADIAHVVPEDEIEGQPLVDLPPVPRRERGRTDLPARVHRQAPAGDLLGVVEYAVLELDVQHPIPERLELLRIVSPALPEHVGEELHRLARGFQAEEAAGGMDVVEGGLHLHRIGVDGEIALAAERGRGEDGIAQVRDLLAGLFVVFGVQARLGSRADDHRAEAARLGIGPNEGVDADDAGLGGVVAPDAGQRQVRRKVGREGHRRLPREEPGVGHDEQGLGAGFLQLPGPLVRGRLAVHEPRTVEHVGPGPVGQPQLVAQKPGGHGSDVERPGPGFRVDPGIAGHEHAQGDGAGDSLFNERHGSLLYFLRNLPTYIRTSGTPMSRLTA